MLFGKLLSHDTAGSKARFRRLGCRGWKSINWSASALGACLENNSCIHNVTSNRQDPVINEDVHSPETSQSFLRRSWQQDDIMLSEAAIEVDAWRAANGQSSGLKETPPEHRGCSSEVLF